MADRVGLTAFTTSYESKNGELGSETVLNRAVHQVKIELDNLWTWAADGTDTLPTASITELLIDDVLPFTDGNATNVTRSANYIGLRISNDINNLSTSDTWSTDIINQSIQNASLDGGSW